MNELPGQTEMFSTFPVKPPKATTSAPAGKPKWSTYGSATGVRCYDCTDIQIATKGKGPMSRSARWKRTTPEGVLLLCSAHAEDRRVQDALPPLKDKDTA